MRVAALPLDAKRDNRCYSPLMDNPQAGRSDQRYMPRLRRAVAGRCAVELLPRGAYDTTFTPDTAIIGFAFESQTGIHAFATDRRTDFRARPNGLAYVPQGCDVYSQSCQGGEYLKIFAAQDEVDAKLGDRRFSDVADPVATRAAHRIRAFLLTGDPVASVDIEYWLDELVARTVDVNCAPANKLQAGMWMTARRLKLVDELIEARLDDKMTVQDLATALGLSSGFFSRAFKRAIGMSPHAYIIDRRIVRARTLLRSRVLSLSTVALASGFASHAHMTATFRERLGVTPSHLRNQEL
jgi:AraC family transcriptional regulator